MRFSWVRILGLIVAFLAIIGGLECVTDLILWTETLGNDFDERLRESTGAFSCRSEIVFVLGSWIPKCIASLAFSIGAWYLFRRNSRRALIYCGIGSVLSIAGRTI